MAGKYKATGVHKIHSYFSASGGVLSFYRDNASTQLAFGEDDTGLDVKFYGDTASAYVLWDESADSWSFASSVKIGFFGATATTQQTKSTSASDIANALEALGLMSS